ncbi:RNase P subunit p29-like protein [Hygrophoropsis aurantiaca]|uniref:RNase P subunit p29-like protein n=1 Tax=Hygrophoropsis aurantiaca TaxID=72124 RepID=A0ACB8ABQ3_9AGAM|nr:RNase P subunit p29-like protein [Hygrophoropsis aurantiaca]
MANAGNLQSLHHVVNPYQEITFCKKRISLTTDTPFTPNYVLSSLTQSSDRAGIYSSRVKGRQVLLENPARESRAKKELNLKRIRREAEKKKRKAGALGRKHAESKGLWKLEKGLEKFDLFIPLHQLWMGYMSELLGLAPPPISKTPPTAESMPSTAGMHAKLVKADFHGSIISVRQSKNPCLIGISGIVIHETENAFKIVTKKDQLKLIPKANSIFAFAVPLYSTLTLSIAQQPIVSTSLQPALDVPKLTTVLDHPHIEFDLHGNQFCFRSADRAGRKFKAKESIEL